MAGGEPALCTSGEKGGSDPESGGESGNWCPVPPLELITNPFGICV